MTTADDIITKRVRNTLNDTATSDAARRWLDDVLMVLLNDAVTRVVQLRPDSLLASDGTLIVIVPVTDLSMPISIDDKWLIPICHYMCAGALEMQSPEKMNINASNHFLKLFMDAVQGI